ncbi:MAG: hypothetical protein D4R84_09530 [Rhodocyclaceae bacterium]|nr:MAG: hypothetical protein D4R84_09530 [Rhodocyclaceae bacterium]
MCRRQAADLLAAALENRRALSDDVERRLAVWCVRLAHKADAGVAELDREAARWAEPAELDATTKDRIARAVERLADELIDGD